jgi:hypothetical protein
MKRKPGLLLLLLTFSEMAFCQNINVTGNYSYSSRFYNENISLTETGKFSWEVKTEFTKLSSTGSWRISGDSLILCSNPVAEKLIVKESEEKNSSVTTFYISDKSKDPINYYLYVITLTNDTTIYENQFQKSISANRVKAFFLVDSKGLYSPVYYLKSSSTNRLDVLFETKRMFENERWIIKNLFIIPRGADGTIQKYKLEKDLPRQ